jgi:hypothetical protein
MIICQILNLPHVYHIFVEKLILRWQFSNWSHGIQTWFKLCVMTWFNISSTFIKMKFYFKKIWSIFVFLSTQVHYICFHKYIPFSHFIKWNEIVFFSIILPRLYSNIICRNIVKCFQNFKVWNIQTCTYLESNTMWHLKKGHQNVLSPFDVKLTLKDTSFFYCI